MRGGREHDGGQPPPEEVAQGVAASKPAATPAAGLTSLSALDPVARTQAVADLHGGAGNRAIAQLMQGEQGRLARVAKSDDRFNPIREILGDRLVGPFDERALHKAWQTFGKELPAAVAVEEQLWKDSLARGMDPRRIAGCGVADLPMHFQRDVVDVARQNVETNRTLIDAERRRFGLPVGVVEILTSGGGAKEDTAQDMLREGEAEDVQELSDQAAQILAAQRELRQIHVGYNPQEKGGNVASVQRANFDPAREPQFVVNERGNQPAAKWHDIKRLWDLSVARLAAIGRRSPTVYAAMAQGGEASLREIADAKSPDAAREQVGQVLDRAQQGLNDTEKRLANGSLSWADLKPLHGQVLKAKRSGKSSVDWKAPHAHAVAQNTITEHGEGELAEDIAEGAMGIALFAVAEFASGGLATSALVAGTALGGVQAAASWDNYDALAAAAEGAASEETQVVDAADVGPAHTKAILDAVFAMVDIAGPIYKAGKGAWEAKNFAGAAGDVAQHVALDQLPRTASGRLTAASRAGKLNTAEGVDALLGAFDELGVAEAVRRSERSADELLILLRNRGERGQAASKRIQSSIDRGFVPGVPSKFDATRNPLRGAESAIEAAKRPPAIMKEVYGRDLDFLTGKSLADAVRELHAGARAGTVSPSLANAVLEEAIERLGPQATVELAGSWRGISQVLGKGSSAGRKLLAWRDGLFADLERYVTEVLGAKVRRTGTVDDITNDIDFSVIGPNAAENRQKAMAHLAARLKAPNTIESFDRLLMGAGFADPTRAHMYDALPEGMVMLVQRRQAAREEHLMLLRDLHAAEEAGDQAMAGAIRKEMAKSNLKVMPYVPLTAEDRLRLGRKIDRWEAQMADPTADQVALVEKIGDAQALINASEGGAYGTGGAIRRWVTERPGETGFVPRGLNRYAGKAERYAVLRNQVSKLDHAKLKLASGDPEEVLDAVREIGKFGQRLKLARKEFAVDDQLWDDLDVLCADLKQAADGPGFAARMGEDGAEEVLVQARWLYDRLRRESADLLAEARRTAAMPGSGDLAGMLDEASLGHLQVIRATDSALHGLAGMKAAVKAAQIGKDANQLWSEEPAAGEPALEDPDVVLLPDEQGDDVVLLDDEPGGSSSGAPAPDARELLASD